METLKMANIEITGEGLSFVHELTQEEAGQIIAFVGTTWEAKRKRVKDLISMDFTDEQIAERVKLNVEKISSWREEFKTSNPTTL